MDKIDYISLVSHEVKTPIANICGYSDIIRNGMTNEETTYRYAGNIYNESRRMGKLVDDLVYIIRAYENELVPQLYSKAVRRIVNDAIERISIRYGSFGSLNINIEGNTEAMIDELMLEEAIFKILENCVLHGNNEYKGDNSLPYSDIDIKISSLKGKSLIEISDSGKGMDESVLNNVFDLFYRADKKHSRVMGCNGLGLSVVKAIITAHGGECVIKSEINKGTTVSLIV
ncbi:MAG: HAMP domain-containing histidine kinase [Lachnospiraceae bacterium]|nr:HAMP domain-containing histidine kinase [Lachnospiraceae bacterium]